MVRRLLAMSMDTILLGVLIFLVAALLALLAGPAMTIEPSGTGLEGIVVYDERLVWATAVAGVCTAVAYFCGSWQSDGGATPGQWLLGLQVRGEDGSAVSAGRAFLRFAALGAPLWIGASVLPGAPGLVAAGCLVLWFGCLLVSTVASDSSRGLHDRLSGTRVVLRRRVRAPMSAGVYVVR